MILDGYRELAKFLADTWRDGDAGRGRQFVIDSIEDEDGAGAAFLAIAVFNELSGHWTEKPSLGEPDLAEQFKQAIEEAIEADPLRKVHGDTKERA